MDLIKKIASALKKRMNVNTVFYIFLPDIVDEDTKRTVLYVVLSIYARMRGKDFCYKLLSRRTYLKVATRQT